MKIYARLSKLMDVCYDVRIFVVHLWLVSNDNSHISRTIRNVTGALLLHSNQSFPLRKEFFERKLQVRRERTRR